MQHPLAPGVELDRHGLAASRQLPDGRWACVSPLLFGKAQLAVTAAAPSVEAAFAVSYSYEDVWHYATLGEARLAMVVWADTGIGPLGWTRHVTAEAS
jgi:hypothetical protein